MSDAAPNFSGNYGEHLLQKGHHHHIHGTCAKVYYAEDIKVGDMGFINGGVFRSSLLMSV